MGTIEEGFCREDTDCSEKQYCYHVSRQCVNYTSCNRYNRVENVKPARSASQCGPCLPNYNAEELKTGEFSLLCKKISKNNPGNDNSYTYWIIGVSSAVSVALLIAIAYYFYKRFYKRRGRKYKTNNSESCDKFNAMQPTAPPVESRPFIDRAKNLSYIPFNNNKILKDKNRLVRANLFHHPSWVEIDPNYENNLNNNQNNVNIPEQFSSPFERSLANDDLNAVVPVPSIQGQIDRNETEFGREQIENGTNMALAQRNVSSSSNATGTDNGNNQSERNSGSVNIIAQINVNVLNHEH